MRKKPLVRFQILVLVVLTGLIVWRAGVSPANFEGLAAVSGLDKGELVERHFEVLDTQASLVIAATGAFETDSEAAPPAAYLWIIDRSSDEIAWSMLDGAFEREGVLMHVADTVSFDPGIYSAYYTTLGPSRSSQRGGSFLGLRPHWTNDTEPLGFSLSSVSEAGGTVRMVPDPGRAADTDAGARTVLLREENVGRSAEEGVMFRVSSPASLNISAQLEICPGDRCDVARIERVQDGATVWELTPSNGRQAGGGSNNIRFNGSVFLDPGIYRAEVSTDRSHHGGDWEFNPPYRPYFWGMVVEVADGYVDTLDPWTGDPLISLIRMGDDESKRVQFEVSDTTLVFVAGMGEIWSSGTRYDYGWLQREGRSDPIWEMTRETTEPAGGDGTNRKAQDLLTLEPGRYSLYYQTDDSHSYEDWLRRRPTHPERWGVVLYVMDSASGDNAVTVMSTSDKWDREVEVSVGDAPAIRQNLLIRHRPLGNDSDVRGVFTLADSARVRIEALGELSRNGRFDYGWIEEVDTGEKVWEMTVQNTVHAGGEDRNRRFEGTLQLPAGRYVVRFETDFDWAYGDFGDGAPDRPDEWGIAVYRAE